jgi:hypothetical protein
LKLVSLLAFKDRSLELFTGHRLSYFSFVRLHLCGAASRFLGGSAAVLRLIPKIKS